MFGQRKIGAIDGLMVGYVDGYYCIIIIILVHEHVRFPVFVS